MMRLVKASTRLVLLAMLAQLILGVALAQQPAPLRQSFDLRVPWLPAPVTIAGKAQLIYELHITNFAHDDLALTRIAAVNAAAGSVLGDFQGAELKGLIGRTDHPSGAMDRLVIPPGVRAVAYLSVTLAPAGVTRALIHRIEYDVLSPTREHAVVEGGAFVIRDQPQLSLGPPLRGGPWAAIYDSSWERGHRRVLYAIHGSAHIPGRFAIDWMKVDKNGKFFAGDGSKLTDWYGYGGDVLAVADGFVAAARDGMPEAPAVAKGVAKIAPENASGNYLALDLGGGRYAFYEHLKPGSIKVQAGDRVRRGQVIGSLGYTGESSGPHLHFHVSDNNSPLDAEGLPYGLESFTLLGAYPSLEAFGRGQPWLPPPAGEKPGRSAEMPAPLSVVEFPAAAPAH